MDLVLDLIIIHTICELDGMFHLFIFKKFGISDLIKCIRVSKHSLRHMSRLYDVIIAGDRATYFIHQNPSNTQFIIQLSDGVDRYIQKVNDNKNQYYSRMRSRDNSYIDFRNIFEQQITSVLIKNNDLKTLKYIEKNISEYNSDHLKQVADNLEIFAYIYDRIDPMYRNTDSDYFYIIIKKNYIKIFTWMLNNIIEHEDLTDIIFLSLSLNNNHMFDMSHDAYINDAKFVNYKSLISEFHYRDNDVFIKLYNMIGPQLDYETKEYILNKMDYGIDMIYFLKKVV